MWNTFQHSAPHCCVHHLPGFPHAAVTRGLGPVHHSARHKTAQARRTSRGQWRSRRHHRAQLERESQDLHVHICTLTPWNITMQKHSHRHEKGDTLTLIHVNVRIFDLPGDLPFLSWSSVRRKSISDCPLICNISVKGGDAGGQDCVSFIWPPFHSEVIRVGAWTWTTSIVTPLTQKIIR